MPDYDPGASTGTLVFSEAFSTQRKDVARRWATAHIRGIRDVYDFLTKGKDKDIILPILAKATGLPTDLAARVQWALTNPDGAPNAKSIEEDQKQLLDWGSINQLISPDQYIDLQFADYAVQQLGKYQG
jgi:hypothetical protein